MVILRKQIQPEFLDDGGQGLLEYSLILFSIAVALILALASLGVRITELFEYVYNNWPLIKSGTL
jgi:Flp pilus assembly pilin Flp